MGIKLKFDPSAFRRRVDEILANKRADIIEALIYVGDACVIHAKSNYTYTDQTGNLTNSIGYVIFEDGEVVSEHFKKTTNGNGLTENPYSTTGQIFNKSREVAKKALKGQMGFVLVIVAGMEYAMFVETKGKVVLAATELYAQNEIQNLLKNFKAKKITIFNQ